MDEIGRVVINANVARRLINEGFVLIDIKPNKYNKDKTCFVFRNTKQLNDELHRILQDNQENQTYDADKK